MVTLATKTKVLAAFRDMKNRGSITANEENELRNKISEIQTKPTARLGLKRKEP